MTPYWKSSKFNPRGRLFSRFLPRGLSGATQRQEGSFHEELATGTRPLVDYTNPLVMHDPFYCLLSCMFRSDSSTLQSYNSVCICHLCNALAASTVLLHFITPHEAASSTSPWFETPCLRGCTRTLATWRARTALPRQTALHPSSLTSRQGNFFQRVAKGPVFMTVTRCAPSYHPLHVFTLSLATNNFSPSAEIFLFWIITQFHCSPPDLPPPAAVPEKECTSAKCGS